MRSDLNDTSGKPIAGTAKVPNSWLALESGGERWLVDLADAGEVLPVSTLSEVPLTLPWFLGVANIRGALYSVTDLAAFHGLEPTAIQSRSRLLLVGARFGSNTALLMSHAHGLKTHAALEAENEAAAPAQPWRGTCFRDSEGHLWTHLLLPELLSAPKFLDVAA